MPRLVAALVLFTLPVVSTANAALHPWAERLREMQAALYAAQYVLQDFIGSVEVVGRDLYRVRSERCSVTVRIVDVPTTEPPNKSGSRNFRAEADKPECP